jgi:hypothetical protein
MTLVAIGNELRYEVVSPAVLSCPNPVGVLPLCCPRALLARVRDLVILHIPYLFRSLTPVMLLQPQIRCPHPSRIVSAPALVPSWYPEITYADVFPGHSAPHMLMSATSASFFCPLSLCAHQTVSCAGCDEGRGIAWHFEVPSRMSS